MAKWRSGRTLWLWLGLTASLWLLAGCVTLCTKHLYLYREAPQKLPPSQVALLIMDPRLVQAAMPGAPINIQGAQWAPDQPYYPNQVYRLSVETVDGQKVYQGLCYDYLPIYAVELRPGSRRLEVKADLLSAEGQEKFRDTVQLDLQAGRAYFLGPDWQELLNKHFTAKLEPLPEAYTPAVRARVIDWEKLTNSKASLD